MVHSNRADMKTTSRNPVKYSGVTNDAKVSKEPPSFTSSHLPGDHCYGLVGINKLHPLRIIQRPLGEGLHWGAAIPDVAEVPGSNLFDAAELARPWLDP